MPMTPEQRRLAGSLGGQTTARRYGPGYYQEIGLKGGDALFRKYGREHFVAAGKKSAALRKARKEGNDQI
jgi:hypothetical protein